MIWLEDLRKDVYHSLKSLWANPMFAAVAVFTLALGIGANTAIFSVVNAVVLRALPVHDPQQLFYLRCDGQPDGASNTGSSDSSFSEYVFEQLRGDKQVFSDVVAYVPLGLNKIAVRAGSLPEEAAAEMVSGNFFTDLGVPAECGRLLTPDDERNHTSLAVLNYGFWNRRFAHNCDVVGHRLSIKGVPFTIAGVAAPRFNGLEGDPTDVWIPLQNRPDLNAWGMQDASMYKDANWWCVLLAVRLAPGVSKTQAEAAANPLFQRAAYEHLGGKPTHGEKPTRLHLLEARGLSGYRDAYTKPLTMLVVMVGVILIIACGNVSLLLAARNASRRREFGVRLALGGSRARLLRQLLAESLVLVTAGGLLGWLFAFAATRALAGWAEMEVDLSPDGRVLLFTLAISVAAGLLSGLAPMLGLRQVSVGESLKTSAATGFRDLSRTRTAQVTTALQVALCLVLLVGAALLVRTLRNLQTVDLGFRSEGLLVFGISPHVGEKKDEATISFYRGLTERLRTLPQVESVTLMQNRVGSGWSNNTTAYLDGRHPQTGSDLMRWNTVGPNYFGTMRIKLVSGRDVNQADTQSSAKVAVVNQSFVRRFLGGRRALGHTVSYTNAAAFTIVGVSADSKYTGVTEDSRPMAYFPYTQVPGLGAMHIELRTSGDPKAAVPRVQKMLSEFAPDLAMLQPKTQTEQFEDSISENKVIARLSAFFGVLAVLLVATGLYGTIAYNVNRRTSEIGIRLALGAGRTRVLWMILREGLQICVLGIIVGVPLAFGASRLLGSLLYGLAPGDPISLGAAMAGIVVVTVLACLLPARRAAAIDPNVALRNE